MNMQPGTETKRENKDRQSPYAQRATEEEKTEFPHSLPNAHSQRQKKETEVYEECV